jgi:RNA polymerase sigma factor (TIGR02999 family)
MAKLPGDLTVLLRRMQQGDREAEEQVFALVYEELRRIASALMASERPEHTLQPTALVNQTFLDHLREIKAEIQDRAHFFSIAAKAMRRVLVDHARKRNAQKRNPSLDPAAVTEFLQGRAEASPELMLDFDKALSQLEDSDPAVFRIFELRHFLGLQWGEIAELTTRSVTEVRREYQYAVAFLEHRLR